jgi:hypothetical protein
MNILLMLLVKKLVIFWQYRGELVKTKVGGCLAAALGATTS